MVGIVFEDGSGVAVDWVTGRSYQFVRKRLDVQSGHRKGGKCAAVPARALPSVIVDTKKVLREGSGWVREAGRGKTADGWKGARPGVQEPEKHKRRT